MLIKTVAIYNRISRDNDNHRMFSVITELLIQDYANQKDISTSYMTRLNQAGILKNEEACYNYTLNYYKNTSKVM